MSINPIPHKSLGIFNHNEIYIEYTKRCSPLKNSMELVNLSITNGWV